MESVFDVGKRTRFEEEYWSNRLLERRSDGYQARKSNVLSKGNVVKFIKEIDEKC